MTYLIKKTIHRKGVPMTYLLENICLKLFLRLTNLQKNNIYKNVFQ